MLPGQNRTAKPGGEILSPPLLLVSVYLLGIRAACQRFSRRWEYMEAKGEESPPVRRGQMDTRIPGVGGPLASAEPETLLVLPGGQGQSSSEPRPEGGSTLLPHGSSLAGKGWGAFSWRDHEQAGMSPVDLLLSQARKALDAAGGVICLRPGDPPAGEKLFEAGDWAACFESQVGLPCLRIKRSAGGRKKALHRAIPQRADDGADRRRKTSLVAPRSRASTGSFHPIWWEPSSESPLARQRSARRRWAGTQPYSSPAAAPVTHSCVRPYTPHPPYAVLLWERAVVCRCPRL